MKNRLFSILLFMCFAMFAKAQIIADTTTTSQLNLDLNFISLDVGYSVKIGKQLFLGLGTGFGASFSFAYIDKRDPYIYDRIHGRIFITNQVQTNKVSWEMGFIKSIVTFGVGQNSDGVGNIGRWYFRPYWGSTKWKIGTQLAYNYSEGTGGFLWTPVLLRYAIYFPKK